MREESVILQAGEVVLEGNLALPENSRGVVIFAHGSGSSRLSPRNRHIAGCLQREGIATLLFDLLTAKEEKIDIPTARLRFDIELLSRRLLSATDWIKNNPSTKDLNIGYFGASTGAAAALVACALRPSLIKAVVSRGGRPDMAAEYLSRVKAPTLLIVGGDDHAVIGLNRQALDSLPAQKKIAIVPGAGHLFEEPGKLDEVASLAAEWFRNYLT
jgi:dienelactone hydrolase